MHVLFDFQIFTMQDEGGVSRYFAELGSHLRRLCVDVSVGVAISDNRYIAGWPKVHRIPPPLRGSNRLVKRVRKTINQTYCRGMLRRNAFDLFHATYFDPYFVGRVGGRPIVLTVYDLIHDIFPEEFKGSVEFRSRIKKCVTAASAIIAISHNTKVDLLRYYDVCEQKVHVVPLGSSVNAGFQFHKPVQEAQGYILFVGKRRGYKNFDNCLKAMAVLAKSRPTLRLRVTGGGPLDSAELRHIASLGLSGKVRYELADDKRLGELYAGALALVYPSRYEGFGLPIVEAFSCGCPVAASNTSSMPEVGGDAALYFEPLEPDSIAEALAKLLNDEEFRRNQVEKGRIRAREFAWEKTARMTKAVYESLVK